MERRRKGGFHKRGWGVRAPNYLLFGINNNKLLVMDLVMLKLIFLLFSLHLRSGVRLLFLLG